MHNEMLNSIRGTLLCILVLTVTIASTPDPQPETLTAAPEPAETETPTETTTPENQPDAATEPPTEKEIPSTYTEEELDMLALVIYQEAGADYCSDDTRLKVGTVVMNRIADNRYPNTMREVITQEAQYGRLHWTGLVWPQRASNPNEAHAVERAYTIAERILQGERALPEDVVYQSEYQQGTEVVAYQDGHYFCR